MPTDSDPLTAAVAALCESERVRVDRDPVAVAAALAEAKALARHATVSSRDVTAVLAAFRAVAQAAGKWADRPSVLSQLRAAVGHGSELGQERLGGGARVPINPDAVDLLDRIRGTVRDGLDALGLDPRAKTPGLDPIHGDLRRLVATGWPDPDARDRLAGRVHRYTTQARNLLDPDPGTAERSARDTSCPTCQALSVTVARDGEWQRLPALRIDLRDGLVRGVQCRACGDYTWRETDPHGQPAGGFAQLRDHAAFVHSQAAGRAHRSRAAAETARQARYPRSTA